MADEQGSTSPNQRSTSPGGLRREHVVAAALVATVTVVLGFASGFGIVQAGAAPGPSHQPAAPGGAPGAAAPASAAPAQQRAGARSPVTAGTRPVSRPATSRPGYPGFSASPGGHSSAGQAGAEGAAALPPEVAAPGAQCSPGLLDALLGLITGVLGGATPAQALSGAGAVPAVPRPAGVTGLLSGPVLPGSAGDVPMYLPVEGRWVPVAGLVPLLDAVAAREGARTAAGQPPLLSTMPAAAGPQPRAQGAPPAAAPTPTAPGAQLGVLSALLAPLGLGAGGAGAGPLDQLLAPVLGSTGCVPAAPAAPAAPDSAPAPGAPAPVAAPVAGTIAGGAGR